MQHVNNHDAQAAGRLACNSMPTVIPAIARPAPESEAQARACNVPCEGDSHEICGGMDSTKVFPVKEHGFCFSTSNGDVLHGNLHQNSTDNDFELCQTTCEIDGTAFYSIKQFQKLHKESLKICRRKISKKLLKKLHYFQLKKIKFYR